MTAQAKANTYTISYNANGGSGTMASTTAIYGSTTTISANTFTKSGYSFAGWTTNSDGSDDGYGWTNWSGTWKYVNGQYGISGGKLVLYARWSANTYTIKYDANGGTGAPTDQSFIYNSGAKISTTKPTKTGYTFVNWKYGNTTLNPGDAVPTGWTNATLQAQWTVNSYYYDVNPDSGIASFDISGAVNSSTGLTDYYQKNPYGQEVTITNVKAKTGYTYTGYTLSGSLTALSGSTSATIKTKLGAGNGAIALNSKINSYTVTYDKNGGSSVSKASASVNYNSAIDLTPTASKSGYEFIGWNTNKNATTALSSLKMGTSNVTLYAIYKKIVTIPTNALCTNPTYNGSSQQITSATSGDGYTLSGYTGTDAKSYTVTATLSGFARWSDGTTANKTFTCSIGKKAVTVTASSGSKTYDGSALSNTTGCSVTSGSVISGHSVTCSNSGSITNKGSATNTLSSVVIKSGTTDVSGNYSITKANGTLTVNARATKCTSGSSSRGYNGSALTNTTGGSCTNLVSGHSATFSGHKGTITNVGSVANTFGSVVIKSGTTDVSGNYSITKANGTLTVSKVNATCPTTTAYSGNFNNAAHSISISGGSGGTIQYSSNNTNWSTTNPSRTVSGSQTTYVRIVGDSNHNTVSCTSRTITINPVTVKAIFNPNGATLTAQTQSAPSGGVASSCSTSSGVVTCTCSIGNSSGCGVTSPAITAPSNSPTVVGFGTSADSHSNSWSPKTQKIIYYNTGDHSYYAQTKHTASFTGTFTGTSEPGISSISSTSVSCNVTTTWNNATPITTCTITSPTITPTTGNNVTGAPAGWYNSSGTRVTGSKGQITLGSNQTFTAKANITAAGVTYSDTYSMGCSTVQCAIDKINTLLK